jgi:hypothetical protein
VGVRSDHAAWGNKDFGAVAPFEDVCLAAEQHDIGWLNWEAAPTLNRAPGGRIRSGN